MLYAGSEDTQPAGEAAGRVDLHRAAYDGPEAPRHSPRHERTLRLVQVLKDRELPRALPGAGQVRETAGSLEAAMVPP